MRMRASWLGSLRPTGYKVAARVPRAPTASSPRTCHPDHNKRAAVLGAVKARPGNDGACGQARATADLDSPCARRPPTRVGRGEETGFQVEQKGLARSGNARVRHGMIQLAWRFLLFQKDSALAQWYRQRTADAPSTRKTLIVALARKLLIALWRLARDGVVPEGVRMRPAA